MSTTSVFYTDHISKDKPTSSQKFIEEPIGRDESKIHTYNANGFGSGKI